MGPDAANLKCIGFKVAKTVLKLFNLFSLNTQQEVSAHKYMTQNQKLINACVNKHSKAGLGCEYCLDQERTVRFIQAHRKNIWYDRKSPTIVEDRHIYIYKINDISLIPSIIVCKEPKYAVPSGMQKQQNLKRFKNYSKILYESTI
ncbi:hypothetical protein ABPG72_021741 [Tetrahymena utriculariae]